MFTIKIPLLENRKYDSQQFLDLFVKQDQYYKTIIPNFEYAVINAHKYGHSNIDKNKWVLTKSKTIITVEVCEIVLKVSQG